MDAGDQGLPTHASEPHTAAGKGRLRWLRAGVLGANDGIVSVAGIMIGVAGATAKSGPISTAGPADLVADAVSMALSEYVSVSTQRDSETAILAKECRELAETPQEKLLELTAVYQARGLSAHTAQQGVPRPVPVTVVSVLIALAFAGSISARISGSSPGHAVVRVVIGWSSWSVIYLSHWAPVRHRYLLTPRQMEHLPCLTCVSSTTQNCFRVAMLIREDRHWRSALSTYCGYGSPFARCRRARFHGSSQSRV